MVCRRCGKSIADGSDTCPVCGISQNTYITPRNHNALRSSSDRRMPRGTLMSIISVVVAVAAVVAMLYFSEKESVKKDYQVVLDAFEEQDETKLWLAVGHFKKKHPDSPLVEDAEMYYKMLTAGLGPGDDFEELLESAPDEQARIWEELERERIENLKLTARDDTMLVEKVTLSPQAFNNAHDMSVVWRNMSDKEIEEVRFTFEALDINGKPVNATQKGSSKITLSEKKYTAPNPSGQAYGSFWMNVWHSDRIDSLGLLQVKIIYEDQETVILPAEVCEYIID